MVKSEAFHSPLEDREGNPIRASNTPLETRNGVFTPNVPKAGGIYGYVIVGLGRIVIRPPRSVGKQVSVVAELGN